MEFKSGKIVGKMTSRGNTLTFDLGHIIGDPEFINNMFKLIYFQNLMNLAPPYKKEIKMEETVTQHDSITGI